MGKAEETKAKILIKAAEIVMKKGYYTATTKEIADAAEVSEGTLFKYFKSKENLLKEIIFELVIRLKDETIKKSLPQILSNKDYSATRKLEYLYKERRQFFDKHEVIIRIVLQEIATNSTVKLLFEKEIRSMINRVVETIMLEGKERGEFRDLPTQSLSNGFINILLAPYITKTWLQNEMECTQDHNQVLFEIFMNGIKEKIT